jgi:hypothetical protein
MGDLQDGLNAKATYDAGAVQVQAQGDKPGIFERSKDWAGLKAAAPTAEYQSANRSCSTSSVVLRPDLATVHSTPFKAAFRR